MRGEVTKLLRSGASGRTSDLRSLIERAGELTGASLRDLAAILTRPAREEATTLLDEGLLDKGTAPEGEDVIRIWPEWSRRCRPGLAELALIVMADGGQPGAADALGHLATVNAPRTDGEPGAVASRLSELHARLVKAQSDAKEVATAVLDSVDSESILPADLPEALSAARAMAVSAVEEAIGLVGQLGIEVPVDALIAHRAHGYTRTPTGLRPAPYFSGTLPGAAGGLASSLCDLLRWHTGLRAGTVIDHTTLTAMRQPTTLTCGRPERYGLGWATAPFRGRDIAYHAGGIEGFSTFYGHLLPPHNEATTRTTTTTWLSSSSPTKTTSTAQPLPAASSAQSSTYPNPAHAPSRHPRPTPTAPAGTATPSTRPTSTRHPTA
jgi:hypothetical protein